VVTGGLYERALGAAGRPLVSYRRRTPERTALHELVAQHAQTMFAELRDADPDGNGLPRYVERELAAYLRCGILAHGFVRVRCQACGDEMVVAFSCKSRGICTVVPARPRSVVRLTAGLLVRATLQARARGPGCGSPRNRA
jgi:hypothetical protein